MQADDVQPPDDGPIDQATADACVPALTLTSTAYTEGTAIPAEHTCDGNNTSPPVAWLGETCNALSFAIVLTDKSNNNLRHSSIYDIAGRSDLPADVDKVFAPPDVPNAHQSRSFNGSLGYRGPCPPNGGGPHTYELKIYALDVASLSNLDMNSTATQVETAAITHQIVTATLTGTYQR
jgi:Raf kinase inhibitor-like YbhB/YbcL family protein